MAASEALALGYGGVSRIQRACGLSRKAIAKGIREIAEGNTMPGRIRRPGAGRKNIAECDPKLLVSLERLLEPETRGDPESPLRWICKSTRNLAARLTRQKHPVSHEKVAQLLRDENYSLQSNRKTEEGADHPDRDAQFRHINAQVKRALAMGMPVISVATKKKELLGNYDNGGKQWLPAKKPVNVNGHDFPSPAVPRAYPYGIYAGISFLAFRRLRVYPRLSATELNLSSIGIIGSELPIQKSCKPVLAASGTGFSDTAPFAVFPGIDFLGASPQPAALSSWDRESRHPLHHCSKQSPG
jgi:hypothetical protein